MYFPPNPSLHPSCHFLALSTISSCIVCSTHLRLTWTDLSRTINPCASLPEAKGYLERLHETRGAATNRWYLTSWDENRLALHSMAHHDYPHNGKTYKTADVNESKGSSSDLNKVELNNNWYQVVLSHVVYVTFTKPLCGKTQVICKKRTTSIGQYAQWCFWCLYMKASWSTYQVLWWLDE